MSLYPRKAPPWHPWYSLARWKRIRRAQLRAHPLCAFCQQAGIINNGSKTATGQHQQDEKRRFLVCDHITPHRGDAELFWNGPFQTLCPDHHDRTKQQIEAIGFSNAKGSDGWPMDPNHPANR